MSQPYLKVKGEYWGDQWVSRAMQRGIQPQFINCLLLLSDLEAFDLIRLCPFHLQHLHGVILPE